MDSPPTGVPVRKYRWPSTSDQYYPDPTDPLDKWFQTNCSANASTILNTILDLVGHVPHQIIDPFSGAGSTAVAARRLNIPFYGIEIDPILAEISSLKVGLSLDDINLLTAVLPSMVSSTSLLAIDITVQRRCVLGASLVAILTGTTNGMPKTELLSLLSEGLATAPPPNPRSHVACADARRMRAWEGLAHPSDTVIFTSPPFHAHDSAAWQSVIPASINVSGIKKYLTKNASKTIPQSIPLQDDSAALISSTLSNATIVCNDFLAIIEYEDSSSNLESLSNIVSAVTALPGINIQEILKTRNFSGKAILYQIVAKYVGGAS